MLGKKKSVAQECRDSYFKKGDKITMFKRGKNEKHYWRRDDGLEQRIANKYLENID